MKIFCIVFTLAFLMLAILHLLHIITVDSITIALLVIALLPWFFPHIKSFELPGGFKVEMKDALKKVEEATPGSPTTLEKTPYAGLDPSLAFVGLRVEIEKTIRKYQPDLGNTKHSLAIRLQVLANENVISRPLSVALLEIIKIGNAAAHGQDIDSEEAELILMRSNALISKLEESLKRPNPPN